MLTFTKYHALGNDYLVLDPQHWTHPPDREAIRRICDRHTGVGADGILYGPLPSPQADFSLRIFNPDGSEAEKSGNGLRIFTRYLWDALGVGAKLITIETRGGIVKAQVLEAGRSVRVEMGRVSFWSDEVPVASGSGEENIRREVLDEPIEAGGRLFRYCAVTLGNPHCVILGEVPTPELARQYGPLLEHHPWFPNRTNVQFLKVLDRGNLQIEIWERGAGYTLASGSSSCAAAAAAYRLGLCSPTVTVHVPGGQLRVEMDGEFQITLTGPVVRVAHGEIDPGLLISTTKLP